MTDDKSGREAYLRSQEGDLTSYAAMLGDGFSHKVDLLAQLIRDAHHPSLGRYKERLLQECIAQFLPKRFRVGTGFVVFPKRHDGSVATPADPRFANVYDHEVSSQLDIIVYDATDYPMVLQDGDFVVVRPEAVRSIVEVKGALTTKAVADSINSFVDYGQKWTRCREFYKSVGTPGENVPLLKAPWFMLMGWRAYVGASGGPAMDGTRLRQAIVDAYQASGADLTKVPLLNAAYLYGDCIVDATVHFGTAGYGTVRGQLVRHHRDGATELAGDGTVADLLAKIHISLGPPINFVMSHRRHGSEGGIPPYAHAGFAALVEGGVWSMSRRWNE